MKKLTLKPNAFEKAEVLSRTQLKKVMGGLENGSGSGDYMCQCDGQVAILWSAQASIDWVNANCSGQYQCDQLPNPQ
ncbi:hypothetical protein H9N25_23810 [Pedobacter riviphilus]|uniref:Natural product n=1 Tax=Pedobacter riviphilus TaxID=2766984 RepID=A0ABX6TI47_9SPHI|nr:hypothetical protein [Pedobacter riviphilus]QNR84861.1 hypothetical protein H9N25_23810 [Pedobacter riviphilus]